MRLRSSLLVLIVICAVSAPVLAQESGEVVGRPGLSVTVSDNHLPPGQQSTLKVTVMNDGLLIRGGPVAYEQRVKTARDVEIKVRNGELEKRYGDSIQLKSGPVAVGSIPEGTAGPIAFKLDISEDIEPGTYEIPIKLSYTYTSFVEYSNTEATRYRDISRNIDTDVTIVVEDRPRFVVERVSSDLFVNDTGRATIEMKNVGTRKATDTRIWIQSRNPSVTVGGAEKANLFIGTWDVGKKKQITVPVTTVPGTIAKEYTFQLQPRYEDKQGIQTLAPNQTIGIKPSAGDRFEVVESNATVSVGESGPLRVTMQNRGNTTVTDATFRLNTASSAVSIDGRSSTTQFVGTWKPGENRTLDTDVEVVKTAEAGQHVVEASIGYRGPDGKRIQSGAAEASLSVKPEQSFSMNDVGVTLRGDTALLSATVRNDGTVPARNAMVRLESNAPSIQVREPTAPVGTLEPGETAAVTFDLGVSPDASSGPRQFRASVQYDRGRDRTYESDPTSISADFPTEEDLFELDGVNTTVGIDSSNRLRVQLTNRGSETYTDVRARLDAAEPYTSEGPTSYVGTLEPGESAILTFEVTTPEDAVSTTDSLPVNVTAESPSAQTIHAGPYLVPITIDGGGPASSEVVTLVIGAVVVIVLLGAGWWWLNQ